MRWILLVNGCDPEEAHECFRESCLCAHKTVNGNEKYSDLILCLCVTVCQVDVNAIWYFSLLFVWAKMQQL